MNKIFLVVWNKTLNQWVVAAENTRSVKKDSIKLVAATASLILINTAQAACPTDNGTAFQVTTANTTCTAALSDYSGSVTGYLVNGIIDAHASGAVVKLTNNNVTIKNDVGSSNGTGFDAVDGGLIDAAGNVKFIFTKIYDQYGSGQSVRVIGSDSAGNYSTVHIHGNLETSGTEPINRGVPIGEIDNANGGRLIVDGNTLTNSRIILEGVSKFGGDVTAGQLHSDANRDWVGQVIANGQVDIGGNLTVGNKGFVDKYNFANDFVSVSESTVHVFKNLNVAGTVVRMTSGGGISARSNGKLSVDGNASIDVINGAGVSVGSNGVVEVLGTNNSISTNSGPGKAYSGSIPRFPGIYVNGSGVVAFGTKAPTTTTGPTVLFSAGSINTVTKESHGIFIQDEDSRPAAESTVKQGGVITTAGIDADGIHIVNTEGKTSIENTGSITSQLGDAIDVSQVAGGSTITNSGNLTASSANKWVILGGKNIDTVTTTAGILTGNTNLAEGNDTFTASGGALVGSTFMGDGNDVATLKASVDVTKAPQFDGGPGTDVLNIEGLTINGFTGTSNDSTGNDLNLGNNLTNWETINLNSGAQLNSTANLFAPSSVGTLNIDGTSTLNAGANTTRTSTINGNVNNSGTVNLVHQNGVPGNVLTITGNYAATNGKVNIATVLGNDSSATDKLVVNGDTSGTSTISITNAGGAGAQTVEGIQVVQVDGNSAGTFSLASPVQASAYEYQLFQGGTSTPTDGDWYLRSHLTTVDCKVTNTCTPIYRPGVAGYVAAQTANAHQGFDQLGTLHERMGEQRHVTADGKQTWGRIYHREESNDGHDRFSYDQNSTGFQIGQDLWVKRDNQAQKHAGVSLSYVHSNADFSDSVRPLAGLEAGTGSMSADSIGIGGYYTHMGDDGRYLDVVGQISHLRNKFTDSYAGKATQTGWRAGLSAEVGKPVAEYKGWKFEPQAQLSYQYTDYGSFNDAISKVDGYDAHTLRGRVGLRVHKDANYGTDRQAQYYAIGNVIHDFIKPEAVTIGNTTVRENFDRTYWELGAGIQGQVAKNTYVYADARYQQSFQNNQHAGKVNIGIKTKF